MKLRTDQAAVIAGMRGTGKTNLLKALIVSLTVPYTVYDPLDQYGGITKHRKVPYPDTVATFDAFCKRIWEKGNHLLIIEECEVYLRNGYPLPPYAQLCILRGRNKGIGIWMCTRRIADMHKTPVSQADHLFLFRMFLPNDIRYLAEFLPKEQAAALSTIPAWRFLHYSHGETELCPPVSLIE